MKIGIAGCNGRVGKLLVDELQNGWDDLTLIGGYARNAESVKTPNYPITDDIEELFQISEIVIDFTLPEATRHHIALAKKHGTTLIIGTTGLNKQDEEAIKDAAQNATIIYAANMSLGVNLLLALVEKAAASLDPSWDIEIFESHHKHKIDAPSGTALAIGQSAAKGRKVDLNDVKVSGRDGITGERKQGDIGFSVARGGDVVGEHTAFFYSAGERIELTHRATNRSLFARGALQAAKWYADTSPANGLYSMQDVLGL